MHEHQRILRKILALSAGLVLASALIAADLLLCAAGPGWPFFLGLATLAVSGFFGARWFLATVEAFTSYDSLGSLFLTLLVWILAVAFMLVLLPIVIVVMLVQYWIARKRFMEEAAERPAP